MSVWTLMLLLGLEPGFLRSFSLHPSCHTYDLSRLTFSSLKWKKKALVIILFYVHSINSKPIYHFGGKVIMVGTTTPLFVYFFAIINSNSTDTWTLEVGADITNFLCSAQGRRTKTPFLGYGDISQTVHIPLGKNLLRPNFNSIVRMQGKYKLWT
jgi:hypothetical protein